MPFFSHIYQLKCVIGAQKNCLIEAVLLSTHNIGFGLEIRLFLFRNQIIFVRYKQVLEIWNINLLCLCCDVVCFSFEFI